MLGIFYILWCNLDSFFTNKGIQFPLFCRGEKAFCSAECRDKHIRSDDHKEKCRSEALKSLEYSVSPCSSPLVFLTGVAVAWKYWYTYIVNNRRMDGKDGPNKLGEGSIRQSLQYNSICKNFFIEKLGKHIIWGRDFYELCRWGIIWVGIGVKSVVHWVSYNNYVSNLLSWKLLI